MEKNGQNHNCRLWVSFDSPHQGANIPIGAQWWLEYYKRVAGNKGAGDALDKQIGSPAAQQMLIDHWKGHVPSSSSAVAASPFRSQFMQNLQTNGLAGSNGMPQNLRKVALTNGSGSGVLQGTACNQVFNLKGYSRNWTHFIPLIGPLIRVQATESNIYFTSNYGSVCKVFDGWYSKFVWNNKQYEEKYTQTPTNTKSYDIVPGGFYNTIEFIKEEGSISDALSYTTISNVVNNHSFIPTVSALSLNNSGSRDWSENLSTRNLVCTGETPFNDYYTPVNNEEHVFLTSSSVDWVKAQLNNLPPPSPYLIQRISGNEPICESTATFKVMNLPTGATVKWSTTSNNITLSPVNGDQTTVTRIANGTATLIATVNTCAGTTISYYDARVGGYGSNDSPISGPSSASCGQTLSFSTVNLPGATNYNWFWPSDFYYISGQGTPYLTIQAPYTYSGGMVGVSVANACVPGGGSPATKFINISCSGYYYTVSPNPAFSDVKVTVKKEAQKTEKQKVITEVRIYDQQSNLKKLNKFNKVSDALLNVSGLSSGMYIIEIRDGNDIERQQLRILK